LRERRAARRLALDVLYEAEIRGTTPSQAFASRQAHGWLRASGEGEEDPAVSATPPPEVIAYAFGIVQGVEQEHERLDELIARYADRWAIERMPVIDRTLLRMAIYELGHRRDVPTAVVINEAVEVAKDLSTEDSGRFVNGLLGRIAEEGHLR